MLMFPGGRTSWTPASSSVISSRSSRAWPGASPANRYRWTPEELPYYKPDAHPEVHARMNRLAFFENSRAAWLKDRFAHHVGVLGVKT